MARVVCRDARRPTSTGMALVVWLSLLCLSACTAHEERSTRSLQPPPAFRNIGTGVAFTGSAECASCHEDEYQGYRTHGMARSLYRLTEENRVEETVGVDVYDSGDNLHYTVVEEDDGLYVEEYGLDGGGRRIHSLRRRIDFVVGSGTAARTYLTVSNGRVYELPLTWYTQKERWDFSPGYAASNARFDRLIPARCMACHNDYPDVVPGVEGKYREVPLGIGCERCHGPGQLHVNERLAVPEPAGDWDDTIVNPARLPLDRRLDVCQQCHLHAAVSLLREPGTEFEFRPSQRLSEFMALFAREDDEGETIDVISHADRMKSSMCFKASQETEAPLQCSSCHDPHQGFRELGPDYFNERCLACHASASLETRLNTEESRERHAAPADCISCHMPKVAATDAPHSSFTDHWTRVVDERRQAVSADSVKSRELVPYFEEDLESRRGQVYQAMALVALGRQSEDREMIESGAARLGKLLQRDTTVSEASFLHGIALMDLGRPAEAVAPLERAVRASPDVPERLNALAQAYELSGGAPARTARLYRRALEIQPAASAIRVNYGRFLQATGKPRLAIAEFRKAIKEEPWSATAHFNLAVASAAVRNQAAAEEAYVEAIRLNPLYAEAMGNLAALYAIQGDGRAEAYFERAAEVAPAEAIPLGNLGAYRLNQGEEAAAIPLLEAAVALDPMYVDASANLALAYFRVERYDDALRQATATLEIDPGSRLARQVKVATE